MSYVDGENYEGRAHLLPEADQKIYTEGLVITACRAPDPLINGNLLWSLANP